MCASGTNSAVTGTESGTACDYEGKVIANLLAHSLPTQSQTASTYTGWWMSSANHLPKLFGNGEISVARKRCFVAVFGHEMMRRQLTSYPPEEVRLALNLVSTYCNFDDVVNDLLAELGDFSNDLTSEKVFALLDRAIARLIPSVQLHHSIETQVRRELRMQLYCSVLKHKGIQTRRLSLGDNTCRDGSQSNCGRSMDLEQECLLIQQILGSGLPITNIETSGGAYPQFDMLPDLVGDFPVLPFERSRRCMLAQAAVMEQLLTEAGANPKHECFAQLFQRFTVAECDANREILSSQDVAAILDRLASSLTLPMLGSEERIGKEIIRIYRVMQNYLFRGKYGFALNESPEPAIPPMVRLFHQHGCDVLRIFDGLNYLPNMLPAINAALAAGMLIQPVLHADPHYALGIDGFVQNMQQLIQLCGKRLEAVVVKDAPGIVEPSFAFKLGKRLSEELAKLGVGTTLVFHTHENSGSSILSCLEFVRGCGPTQNVRIECAFGKGVLSSPNGQPDIEDFLYIVMGTNWQPATTLAVDDVLAKAERIGTLAKSFACDDTKPPIELTTEDRLLAVEAGLPGGMTGTYLRSLFDTVKGYRLLLRDNFKQADPICDGVLTESGKHFLRAYFRACMYEMILVNREIGYVSRVTPVSQWIGAQAKNLVDSGFGKSFYDYKQVEGLWTLVRNGSYNRDVIYTLSQPVKNHLIVLATTPGLQVMYPAASRKLMRLAFAGLTDYQQAFGIHIERINTAIPLSTTEPIDTESLLTALGLIEKVKELSGRPSVDVEVFAAVDSIMKSTEKDRILAELSSGLMTREQFITFARNPLFMTAQELDRRYGRENLTLSDFVLLACFTQANLGATFIERREKALAQLAMLPAALRNMGVVVQ